MLNLKQDYLPGAFDSVPATCGWHGARARAKLRSTLGVTADNYVTKAGQLAVVDETLG